MTHNQPLRKPMNQQERRQSILDAIAGYIEYEGTLTARIADGTPVGIHVDRAEDIPDFIDKVRTAVLDELRDTARWMREVFHMTDDEFGALMGLLWIDHGYEPTDAEITHLRGLVARHPEWLR